MAWHSLMVTITVTEALVLRPPTRRPRMHHPGVCRQNETEMFLDHDETSPSIAAVSALSAACSMLAVQQQKKLCRQFVNVSTARWGWKKSTKTYHSHLWLYKNVQNTCHNVHHDMQWHIKNTRKSTLLADRLSMRVIQFPDKSNVRRFINCTQCATHWNQAHEM